MEVSFRIRSKGNEKEEELYEKKQKIVGNYIDDWDSCKCAVLGWKCFATNVGHRT